jgi:hypothetical protein
MDAGQGAEGKVVSLSDGNEILKNGVALATFNKGERWAGPVNDFDEFSARGPIYGSVRAGGEHVMASGRLKGRSFSFGNDRRSALGIWTRALETEATCTVTTSAGVIETTTIAASTGYVFSFATPTGSDQGVTVVCDADVVVSTGHTSETDYMVLAPEASEWYGIASSILSLSQSGANPLQVIESCSDGSTRTLTIPGGGTGAISDGGYLGQYAGKACTYTAAGHVESPNVPVLLNPSLNARFGTYIGCKTGGSWSREGGNVPYSAAGAQSCLERCRAGNYQYGGLECPMANDVHCQCSNSPGTVDTNDETCARVQGHCSSPTVQWAFSFGGHSRGSVYDLAQTSSHACDSDRTAHWTHVRHTDGNTHPANDNLCGSHVYGTPRVSESWSVDFEQTVPGYDEFLFASGDCDKWIVMTKAEAIGSDGMREYSNAQLNVMRGSASGSSFTTNGYRRRVCGQQAHEDPWIQYQNAGHNQCDAIYVNNGYPACGGNGVGAQHGGLDVYIRNSATATGSDSTAVFSVHGYGDGSGGDAVNFLPTNTGSMVLGASTDFQWLAFASLEAGTCACTHGTAEVNSCDNGICTGRISGGAAGVTCDCTVPMFGVLECTGTDDEQLFYGDLAYGMHGHDVHELVWRPATATLQHFQAGACTQTGLVFDGDDDYILLEPPGAIDEVGDVTIAMSIKYNSIEANYERVFDFDAGSCGASSFFADVHTSHRMTLQIYDCGNLGVDNFWLVGDGQFHAYVFMVTVDGVSAFRDGISLGSNTNCRGVPEVERAAMYVGGSTCMPSIKAADMELEWMALWDRTHPYVPYIAVLCTHHQCNSMRTHLAPEACW